MRLMRLTGNPTCHALPPGRCVLRAREKSLDPGPPTSILVSQLASGNEDLRKGTATLFQGIRAEEATRGLLASLLGASTLLGAPGLTTRNKKLLGARTH